MFFPDEDYKPTDEGEEKLMDESIMMIQEKIQKESGILTSLRKEIAKVIIGQEEMIDKLARRAPAYGAWRL